MSYGGYGASSFGSEYTDSSPYSSPEEHQYSTSHRQPTQYFSQATRPQYSDAPGARHSSKSSGSKDPNCVLRVIRSKHRDCHATSPHTITTYKVLGKRCARHSGSQPPRACYEESKNGRTYTDEYSYDNDPCPRCEAISPGARSRPSRSEYKDQRDGYYPSSSNERYRHSPEPYRDTRHEVSSRPKLKRGYAYGP